MKDMIKVNKIDHPKKIFMKVPCRESTENTKKSAFLSIALMAEVRFEPGAEVRFEPGPLRPEIDALQMSYFNR